MVISNQHKLMAQSAAIVEQLSDIVPGVIPLAWGGGTVHVNFKKTRNDYAFGCVSDIAYTMAGVVAATASKADKDKMKNSVCETLKHLGLNNNTDLAMAVSKVNNIPDWSLPVLTGPYCFLPVLTGPYWSLPVLVSAE